MGLGGRSLEQFIESAAMGSGKTPGEKAAEVLAIVGVRSDGYEVAERIVEETDDTTLITLQDDLKNLV